MRRPSLVQASPTFRLDYAALRAAAIGLAVILIVIAPFARDPMAFAAGAIVPFILISIIGSTWTPAALVYLLLWQWLQTFARVVQSLVDGESIYSSLYGPTVGRAYWYMLASVIVLALGYRTMIRKARLPTAAERTAHLEWRPVDLFVLYLAAVVVSIGAGYVDLAVPALDQQLEMVERITILAVVLLFTNVLATGQGRMFLLAAVLFEVVKGFSGILGDFRGVFVFLAISAIAARIRLSPVMVIALLIWMVVLAVLGTFWTAIKVDYRHAITGTMEGAQQIRASLGDRLGYLGNRATDTSNIDWEFASYALLSRLAYVDIFGSVIGVQEVTPEPIAMRQWNEALEHVLKPRFLFPGKAALSDTEVYVRLALGNVSDEVRYGTSISVGYMGENFADLGFPGMLAGIFVLGLLGGAVCRYFMAIRLPLMVREALAMTFVYAICHDGVEISLPKLLGSTLMFFLVYAPTVHFLFPIVLRWLNERSAFPHGPALAARRR